MRPLYSGISPRSLCVRVCGKVKVPYIRMHAVLVVCAGLTGVRCLLNDIHQFGSERVFFIRVNCIQWLIPIKCCAIWGVSDGTGTTALVSGGFSTEIRDVGTQGEYGDKIAGMRSVETSNESTLLQWVVRSIKVVVERLNGTPARCE